jgi:hypothetical protein
MKRFGPFAFAVFLSILPISASASAGMNRASIAVATGRGSSMGERGPIVLAELQEQSIPAQDLAAPSPGTAPSPGVSASPAAATNANPESNPESGQWIAVPAGKAPPAEVEAPAANPVPPAAQAAPPVPADIAPAIDVGSIAAAPQISDASLAPLIDTAPTPARAASLRITEAQRIELERGNTNDAIRQLAYAISIDPSNSYAYFYLGRAYDERKSYGQALTFFKRAEIGLASNPVWLGETYAFEGLSLEQAGRTAEAAAAYQKALAASPGNLTARVGLTRMSPIVPAATTAAAPATALDQPAPAEPEAAPAPDEAPAPPAPASAPPPSD